MPSLKARMDRSRRQLARHGYRLATHRGVHPYSMPYKGFVIIDVETNCVAEGTYPFDFAYSIDDVEEVVAELNAAA